MRTATLSNIEVTLHEESFESCDESCDGPVEINPLGNSSSCLEVMRTHVKPIYQQDAAVGRHMSHSTNENDSTSDGSSQVPSLHSQLKEGEDEDPLAIILEEARCAIPTLGRNENSHRVSLDERTKLLIQEALNTAGRNNAPTQMRSTKEVLKLANKVLQHTDPTDSNSGNQFNPLVPIAINCLQAHSPEVIQKELARCLSPTESEADEYQRSVVLPSKFAGDSSITREKMLNKIDGVDSSKARVEQEKRNDEPSHVFNFNLFSYLMGNGRSNELFETQDVLNDFGVMNIPGFPPLNCGAIQISETQNDLNSDLVYPHNSLLSSPSAAISVAPPSYAEHIHAMEVDPRMPAWISAQSATFADEEHAQESFFTLGISRTVVVHEVVRGNWTWATAWSPDGTKLAIATENHHLAVVDATSSTVWRVQHDRRITKTVRIDTTHSIRSIAWGSQFIAVGGTGNAVSILAPTEPYPILNTICGTGFVGSLDWKLNSAILAIGSRLDKCIIVNVSATGDEQSTRDGKPEARRIISTILHTIERKDWVDAVTFSPGGGVLAIGDRSGKVSVFSYESKLKAPPKVTKITDFTMGDAVLSVEWSPDGKWLYAGGEDFRVIVVDTSSWQIVHTIKRERWVQFIASSNLGSHLAVGGVNSEVTIFDVNDHWKPVMSIELKGLVPLSAKWHPKDQYLALTGQDYSVIAIETTNARYVHGHYLQSISPILRVAFSPDGRMVAVGNESGVISFYTSNGSSFVTLYEMVLADSASQSIAWSPNGKYVCVGSNKTLIILGKSNPKAMGGRIPPKTSGFGVRQVIRIDGVIEAVSIQSNNRYVAVSGSKTRILDALKDFICVQEWNHRSIYANAWASDGVWFAVVGRNQNLTIYDTSSSVVSKWKAVFTIQCDEAGLSLAWGPTVVDGLQYLAYGGEDKKVTIIEIRTYEGTWETVLEIPRNGVIYDLDWGLSGMLAAAVGDGTVTVIDLAYLQAGWAVNEMDYNWQRQGVTCFAEIRRSKGANSMRSIQWIPEKPGSDSLLAIGGTDGALEVIDLTKRQHCKGFGNNL